MTINRTHYQEYIARPTLHLMSTMKCNLKCNYCPVIDYLRDEVNDGLSELPIIERLIEEAPEPLAIHLGGGEPLLNKTIGDFVKRHGENGHKFSFDTNGTVNAKQLERIVGDWDPNWIAYFDISHHLDQRVPVKTIEAFAKVLQANDMAHHIKYIGRPYDFEDIERNIAYFESKSIAAWVSGYDGLNSDRDGILIDDRQLPRDYSDVELNWLLSHIRFLGHVSPIAGGVIMTGKPCTGGSQYFYIGDVNPAKHSIWPCCHGQNVDVDIEQSYILDHSRPKRSPCRVESACYIYPTLYGPEIYPEYDGCYSDLFFGPVAPIKAEIILDYLQKLELWIERPADPKLYSRVKTLLEEKINQSRPRYQSA